MTVGSKGAGTNPEDVYSALSPAPAAGRLMPTFTSAAFLGIVEEYRYYIRQEYSNPADTTSPPAPRLARARFFPNTNTAYFNYAPNLSLDVSENIVDLQVALGIDLDSNDSILDNGGNNDEWLFNNSGDNAGLPAWSTHPLYYVRISTLAHTDRYDPQYQGPKIGRIEDHTYPTATGDNSDENRSRRRRIAQSVVRLRNVF